MHAERTLTLLSWNVGRVHLWSRPQRALGWDSRASERTLHLVAAGILRAGADVVALQELASSRQLARLAALLGDEWRWATPMEGSSGPNLSTRGPTRWDRHVGLLVRAGVGGERPDIEVVRVAGDREVLVLGDPWPARRWVVVAAHLEAFDARLRARQVEDLRALVDSRSEETLILLGDLNVDPRHPLYRRGPDAAAFSRLCASLDDLGHDAGPTALLGRRLDHVMFRSRGEVRAELEVLRGRRLPFGDHDPVLARLHSRVARRPAALRLAQNT